MTSNSDTIEATIIRLEKEMAALIMRIQKLENTIEHIDNCRVDRIYGTTRSASVLNDKEQR